MELLNIEVNIADIKKYESTISVASSLIHTIDIGEIYETIHRINYEKNNYESNLISVKNLKDDLNGKKNDIESKMSETKYNIQNLKSEIRDLVARLDAADDEEREKIEEDIENARDEINSLQDELSYAIDEVNCIRDKICQSGEIENEINDNIKQLSKNSELLSKIIESVETAVRELSVKFAEACSSLEKSMKMVYGYMDTSVSGCSVFNSNLDSLDYFDSEKIRLPATKIASIENRFYVLGDLAKDTLGQAKQQFPDKYEKILALLMAKGDYSLDAIYDLKKMLKSNTIADSLLSSSVIEMTDKIYSSELKKKTEWIRNLPPIRLTQEQEDGIWKEPEYIMQIVKEYTGKEFRDGFQEFFIRLAKNGNQQQMERIWKYSNVLKGKVKDTIKNKGIRLGGNHEWLMCENYGQFLYNTKWGRDGIFLSMLITELIQATDDVYMEDVKIWNKENKQFEMKNLWTHQMESNETKGMTFRNETLIHNTIMNCMEKSSTAAEVLVNLEQNIKSQFSEETYKNFRETLENCLKRAESDEQSIVYEKENEKKSQLDNLMSDWKDVIKTKEQIIFPDTGTYYDAIEYFYSDGFYPGYFSAKKKILFIGREARYASGNDRVQKDLEWFKNDSLTGSNYWRRLFYIAYGIEHDGKISFENIPNANDISTSMLENKSFNFAIMNVSKYSNDQEDGATANFQLINQFLKDSDLDKRNFVREEIEMLDPDIIITANLWDGNINNHEMEKIFPLEDFIEIARYENCAILYDFHFEGKNIHLVDLYHFSSIGSDKERFYDPVMKLLFK